MDLRATDEYIDLLTSALTTKTGIKVERAKRWSTNIKKKILYYEPLSLKQFHYLVVKGILLHEIGHLLHTEVTQFTKLQKKKPAMQECYNAFEDMRIEDLLEHAYGDFATDGLTAERQLGIIKQVAHLRFAPKIEQFLQICLIDWCRDEMPYSNLKSRLEGFFGGWRRGNSPLKAHKDVENRYLEKREAIHKIRDECIASPNCRRLKEIIDKKLYPLIKDFLDDEDKKTSGGSGSSEKENDKSSKKENDEKGGGNKKVSSGGSGGSGTSGGGGGTSDSNIAKKINKLASAPSIKGDKSNGIGGESRISELEAKALFYPYASVLAERLKNILKDKKAIHYRGSKKSGKLLSKNAYKVILGENKVFSKKTTPDSPDYAFHLVLDCSGSMDRKGRSKRYYTFLGSCLLEQVAEKLGFPIKFFAFDNKFYPLEKLDSYRTVGGGGTKDIEALEEVYKRIFADKDNLIFVFTDGFSHGDPRPIINKIEKKNSTLIGVCFDLNTEKIVARYPNYIALKDSTELPRELLRKLKRLIHR